MDIHNFVADKIGNKYLILNLQVLCDYIDTVFVRYVLDFGLF